MPRFLFATPPGAGHVNPMLAVARELVARGEHVEVWSTQEDADEVRAIGAGSHTYPGMAMPGPGTGRPRPRTVAAVFRMLRHAPPGLAEAAAEKGAVLVYDLFTGWSRGLEVPSVALATSTVLSGPMLTALLAGRVTRRDPERSRRLDRRLQRTALPRLLHRLPLPVLSRAELTLVTVPRELQPRQEVFGPEYVFVGPCVAPRTKDADSPVLRHLAGDDRPLVLVSLGTTPLNRRPAFYRACYRAFEGTGWNVVLAAGQHTDIAALGPPPPNVLVVDRAPQLDVLARASAFVSHGGMNSVLESLEHGVPLVLFPQQPEQRANADRVAAGGAGVRLPKVPTPHDIRDAVTQVLTDPGIAAATARMQAVVRACGGPPAAADTLQEFAARHAPAARS